MALKIAIRKAEEVPQPGVGGGNADLDHIKAELAKLQPGMVLEVDAGSLRAVRGTKAMLTRAGNQIGRPVVHWQLGTIVYAKTAARSPGRPRKAANS